LLKSAAGKGDMKKLTTLLSPASPLSSIKLALECRNTTVQGREFRSACLSLGKAKSNVVDIAGDGVTVHEKRLKGCGSSSAEWVEYHITLTRQPVNPCLSEGLGEHSEIGTK
jgi:hypothetical protein